MMPRSRPAQATGSRRSFLERVAGGCATALLGAAARRGFAGTEQDRGTRIPSIDERIRADASAAPLRMQFRGTTAAECRAWQESFRRKLLELLGNPAPPAEWKAVPE